MDSEIIISNRSMQTIESFGVSGSWWSQDIGGWAEITESQLSPRDYIAQILFDEENGIGISSYRYNIGAGSISGNNVIEEPWRKTENFEQSEKVYDWARDKNSVWFLKKAVQYGIEDIVFFVNSPVERLTRNGKAHGNEGELSNLPKENYVEFAEYVFDVVEHFIEGGIKVRYISPINEPQWEWINKQEGCHYEPDEVVELLRVFVHEIEKRPKLVNVEITGPECGEWGNTNYKYCEAILGDKELSKYFKTLDNHSYWSSKEAKKEFAKWIHNNYDGVSLRTSEWCEMVKGQDYTMDSALNLAEEIYDDLTILDVVSWQYWIAVSCYDFRDGLIYVNPNDHSMKLTKRLWAMGNYSKFVRPGFTRIDVTTSNDRLKVTAFRSDNKIVLVIINSSKDRIVAKLSGYNDMRNMSIYVTDQQYSLEQTYNGAIETNIKIKSRSVVTVNFY